MKFCLSVHRAAHGKLKLCIESNLAYLVLAHLFVKLQPR